MFQLALTGPNLERMIFDDFDFGCRVSADLLAQIFPVLHGALACVAIVVGLAVLGRIPQKRCAISSSRYTLRLGSGGSLHDSDLRGIHKTTRNREDHSILRYAFSRDTGSHAKIFQVTVLASCYRAGCFILIAINVVGIAAWDDFSHWVPNALYLWQYDDVPGRELPSPYSFWPGYPYALPFLTYLASHLAGGFLVEGGAMMNFLLLLAFAAMLTEIGHPKFQEQQVSLMNVGWLCLALLAVTLFNPSFNTSFAMTNQGDTATMVVTGALGLMFWKLIDAIVQKDRAGKTKLIIQLTIVSTLLVLIKQSNLALLVLLIIAFMAVVGRTRVLKEVFILVVLVLTVAVLFRYLWQYHVDMELNGNGKGLSPVYAWKWDLLVPILSAMGYEALRRSACFGLILVAGMFALANLFRTPDRTRDFAIIAGIVGGGYVAFLIICYLGGAFHEEEARKAAVFLSLCHPCRPSQHGIDMDCSATFLGLAAGSEQVFHGFLG